MRTPHSFAFSVVSPTIPRLYVARWHKRVDLTLIDGTAIAGEWAYPMVARGRLVGALVLGPKRSEESYAPDESDAVTELALGTASALDALRRGDGSRLARIQSL